MIINQKSFSYRTIYFLNAEMIVPKNYLFIDHDFENLKKKTVNN